MLIFLHMKSISIYNEINKKLVLPLTEIISSSTSAISYTTHPQAIYTSRLLDFKNLPEPKNADSNDDSFEILR